MADALSLLANIIVASNTTQMQAVLNRWANWCQVIPADLAGKIARTRLQGINLRGVFRFPVERHADEIMSSQATLITGTNGRNRSRFDALERRFKSEQETQWNHRLTQPPLYQR